MADEPFDDELSRALRAPGTQDELGEEERYVAMFRAAHPTPVTPLRRRRGAARLGGTLGVVFALGVAGGGVAAAYTGNLPEPLQELAHDSFGPVGVPPADEKERKTATDRRAPEPPTPTTSEGPSPTPQPTPTAQPTPTPTKPSGGSDKPKPSESETTKPSEAPTTAAPSAVPPPVTPTPTPAPEPTPTPTEPTEPPTLVPARLSVSGGTHDLDVGQTTVLSGVLAARDGTPVAGVRVSLQRRTPGGWARVDRTVTDESGAAAFTTPPATETAGYRLRSSKVHSSPWRLAMHPLLMVSAAEGPEESVVITGSAQGGQAGDPVRLMLRKKNGTVVQVATTGLGADGSVQFQVRPDKRRTRYVVVLEKTPKHTRAHSGILVTKPARDSDEESGEQGD